MESPLSILEIVNFFNFIGFGPERDDCFSSQFEQRNIYFNTFCSTAQKSKTHNFSLAIESICIIDCAEFLNLC